METLNDRRMFAGLDFGGGAVDVAPADVDPILASETVEVGFADGRAVQTSQDTSGAQSVLAAGVLRPALEGVPSGDGDQPQIPSTDPVDRGNELAVPPSDPIGDGELQAVKSIRDGSEIELLLASKDQHGLLLSSTDPAGSLVSPDPGSLLLSSTDQRGLLVAEATDAVFAQYGDLGAGTTALLV